MNESDIEEIWKSLVDGAYEVSNLGNVRSLDRDVIFSGKLGVRKGQVIRQALSGDGYLNFHISVNGIAKAIKTHRAVAQLFIPNPDNKPQVNHKDGNRVNNIFTNLEWVDQYENMAHACINNLVKNGEDCKQAVLCESDIPKIRQLIASGLTNYAIGKMYNVNQGTIWGIKTGKNWKHVP
jgi:hypothetical protein